MFAFALTACGGGGSGGGSSSSPTPEEKNLDEPTVETKEVTTSESSTQSVSVSSTKNMVLEGVPEGVSFDITENSINFTLSEVDRPTKSTIKVKDSVTGDVLFKISLFIENTSARDLVDKVNHSISQTERLLSLEDDKKIYFYVVDMLYLKGDIPYSEKKNTIDSFAPEDQESHDLANEYSSVLNTTLNQYNEGEVGEQELSDKLELFENAVTSHGQYGANAIASLQSISTAGLPPLSSGEIKYNAEENLYSRFIGEEVYGKRVNGEWVYNSGEIESESDYSFLSKIVNVNLAGTCSI